ncbi:hypothetical protein FOL47_000933 [Perkinsus chesapeaki]|uniref:Uncharacterized protein n=1 Tax=Perkinsus chesapeaki TaxID=330153 RepID=A0A7J6N116_PERCH|nr:hypothetical protein FOL47_000933 [Perkinsus chesapeaki]
MSTEAKSEVRDEDDRTTTPSPPPSTVDTDQSLFESDRFRPARLFPIGITVDEPVKAGLACKSRPRWRRRPVLQPSGLTLYHWEKVPDEEENQQQQADGVEARPSTSLTTDLPPKYARTFQGEEGLVPATLDQRTWVKIKEETDRRFKCTCSSSATTSKPVYTQEECQYLLEAAKTYGGYERWPVIVDRWITRCDSDLKTSHCPCRERFLKSLMYLMLVHLLSVERKDGIHAVNDAQQKSCSILATKYHKEYDDNRRIILEKQLSLDEGSRLHFRLNFRNLLRACQIPVTSKYGEFVDTVKGEHVTKSRKKRKREMKVGDGDPWLRPEYHMAADPSEVRAARSCSLFPPPVIGASLSTANIRHPLHYHVLMGQGGSLVNGNPRSGQNKQQDSAAKCIQSEINAVLSGMGFRQLQPQCRTPRTCRLFAVLCKKIEILAMLREIHAQRRLQVEDLHSEYTNLTQRIKLLSRAGTLQRSQAAQRARPRSGR